MSEPDGSCVYLNPRCAEVVGLPIAACLGFGWAQRLHPDDRAPTQAAWDQAIATGQGYRQERRYVHEGGQCVRALVDIRPEHDAEGRVRAWFGTTTDITAERSSHDELARFFELSSELLCVAGEDGTFRQLSESWERVLDFPREQLLSITMRSLVHPDDRQVTDAALQALRRNGGLARFQNRCRTRKGDWRKLDWSATLDTDSRRMHAVARDISEQGEFEARLRLAGAVFDHALEGIMVTNAQGLIVAVNAAFSEITGYSSEEALGKRPKVAQAGTRDRALFGEILQSLDATGRWQGEVWNRRRNGEIYPQWLNVTAARDPAGQTTHIVALFSDVTELRSSEMRLERLAHYDPLTGLANRTLLFSRLEHAVAQARRQASRVAVLFLDLDRFKNINDSLGHPVGDELLISLSRRLQHRIRTGDTFARLGGDEFVVVMEALREPTDAASLAAALAEQLAEPFTTAEGAILYVSVSIGISLFPDNGQDAASLIRNADAAMYHAKEGGRGTYRFYTSSLTDAVNLRLELDTRLRGALEREEFILQYQAKYDPSGRITGAEALVRWQPNDRPMVPPNQFIPVAEDTGLIIPLGEWVLREACREARRWLDEGLGRLTVAVNVSNVQFRSRHLVDRVREILGETRLPPELLEIEITESAIMEPVQDAVLHLDGLRSLGVQLALDDFGTGYSSLAALKRLPLQVLKVDQSFVRGLPEDKSDEQIVRTIVTMAQNLGLTTTAEGVETPAQLDLLRAIGCNAFQGYLMARPEPAEGFVARVRAQR